MLYVDKIDKPVIFLVGAGGTGGFTYTNLSRLLAGTHTPIHLYDGDLVEAKNLKRQQFIADDLGKNKATVLANHMNEWMIQPVPTMVHDNYLVDSDSFLADIMLSLEEDEVPIIISAVDNVATRKLINETIAQLDIAIAIDSGNNNQGGQVVWTSTLPVKERENPFGTFTEVQLANMLEAYPQLQTIEDDNPGLKRSCDEVVESEPQAMMANSRNADIIVNIVMHLLSGKPLVGNVFESNLEDFTTKVKTAYACEG